MWTNLLFAILVFTYVGTLNAVAMDRTWYCSTIFERAKEPTTLKFEVKDGSLFALTHLQHLENFLAKYEGRSQEIIPKQYKIVEDTDKSLIFEGAMTTPQNPDLENKVVTSLQNPQFTWRTANGVSREIGLDPSTVATFLENSPLIIRSSTANTAGQPLYSLRSRYRENTPFIYRVLSAITNST